MIKAFKLSLLIFRTAPSRIKQSPAGGRLASMLDDPSVMMLVSTIASVARSLLNLPAPLANSQSKYRTFAYVNARASEHNCA